ncbi:MAG: alanine--tRNA ligase [Deltaproteobacteria bacterium]|nr:alanine--tRNA ligase [Deltaproteobacteria bacterium]
MRAKDIRRKFLEYFKDKNHSPVDSSALIPEADPTLLFTNAGMVQFKRVFTGEDKRPYTRAASCQKCVRAGGKHNDLENVGRTARHHTFFEMLGNFSFGDYFKTEAIEYAWEFLTKEMKLPSDKLYATVFTEDDEAAEIWKDKIKLPSSKIVRLGEKDNFWSMGDTGPCGPCSEILIDQGQDIGCGKPSCSVGCDCDRFLEIWNLVFMQFNRDEKGAMTPLPKPSIDTGMGLERLSCVVQGKKSNYDTDLFAPIIAAIEDASGVRYGKDSEKDVSIKAIADHARATAFLICDGLLPSNEGRGYVLRRIMRRAIRHGSFLGLTEPFLYKAALAVIDTMKDAYPTLGRSVEIIKNATVSEEERFLETLERGLSMLNEEVASMKKAKKTVVDGAFSFKLYDTYGFPIDLTADIVKKDGFSVDEDGFTTEMEKQKEMARQSWKGMAEGSVGEAGYSVLVEKGLTSVFTGYHMDVTSSKISGILKNGALAESAKKGDKVAITTPETPFYAEGGGQSGDTGVIIGKGFSIRVLDTKKASEKLFVHICTVEEGAITAGLDAELIPDLEKRAATCRNHTATHLLHSTLRNVLGKHVRQAGSLVTPEGFRFDFNHFSPLTREDIRAMEERINAVIRENIPVTTEILSHKTAIEKGALAFFGEKYGDTVRMVTVPGVSAELCGGTHVAMTGDIGLIKITSEGSVASGVRRIEATTGDGAIKSFNLAEDTLNEIAAVLKGSRADVKDKVLKLIESQREIERELSSIKSKKDSGLADTLAKSSIDVLGVNLVAAVVEADATEALRTISDALKANAKQSVVVLAAAIDGKAMLLASVTPDITKRISAGEIIKRLAPMIGGKGGGKPDMAQAGGKDTSRITEAIKAAKDTVEELLKGK